MWQSWNSIETKFYFRRAALDCVKWNILTKLDFPDASLTRWLEANSRLGDYKKKEAHKFVMTNISVQLKFNAVNIQSSRPLSLSQATSNSIKTCVVLFWIHSRLVIYFNLSLGLSKQMQPLANNNSNLVLAYEKNCCQAIVNAPININFNISNNVKKISGHLYQPEKIY